MTSQWPEPPPQSWPQQPAPPAPPQGPPPTPPAPPPGRDKNDSRFSSVATAVAILLIASIAGLLLVRGTKGGSAAAGPTTTIAPTASTTPGDPTTTAPAGTPTTTAAPAVTFTTRPGQVYSYAVGRLVHADGSAAPGVPLRVYHPKGAAEVFAIVASLGLVCIGPQTCISDGIHAQTGPDGRFRITLPPDAGVGWRVEATLPDSDGAGGISPASLLLSFRSAGPDDTVALGDLPLWEAKPTAKAGGGTNVDLAWAAPSEGVSLLVVATVGDFQKTAQTTGVSFDRREVEDQPATISVTATTRPDIAGRKETLWRTAQVVPFPDALRGGVPITRGKACGLLLPGGNATSKPCALTDGVFPNADQPRADRIDEATAAIIDAGGSFSAIRVHGIFLDKVEVSADGSTWREVTGSDRAVTAVSGPARYIKVTAATGLRGVNEVSAWK